MADQEMQYETLKAEEIKYGPRENKFIEISRKRAPDSTEFFMISKGFYNQRAEKRYQKGVGFPYDQTIVKFITEKLTALSAKPPAQIAKVPVTPAKPAELVKAEEEPTAEGEVTELPEEIEELGDSGDTE